MKRDLSLGEEIERVEQRIGARRERTLVHYDLAKSELEQRVTKIVSWWPLVAVAGSLVVGIVAARATRRQAHVRRAAYYAEPPHIAARAVPSKGMLASALAIAATALRIAGSNEIRTVFNALRAYRARRHSR